MGHIAEIVVPVPPDLTTTETGAETEGQAYSLVAPATADSPLIVRHRDGQEFRWTPTELVYRGRDADGVEQYDYLVGSSPVQVATRGREARYSRTYPTADDVFIAEAERIKHWTVLHEPPRQPAVYLASDIEFGVSGMIGGVPLPPGRHESIEVWGFTLPRPYARDLQGNEVQGCYEVVDSDAGQVLYIWFPAEWFASATYPVTIDPTVGTSTISSATGASNQRTIARFSNGTLLAVFYENTTNYIVCRYSSDNGETWLVPSTGATVVSETGATQPAVDISQSDNSIYVSYLNGVFDSVKLRRGVPTFDGSGNLTDVTWTDADSGIAPTAPPAFPAVVVHEEGDGAKVHVFVGGSESGESKAFYIPYTVASDGSITRDGVSTIGGDYGAADNPYPSPGLDSTKGLHVAMSPKRTGTGYGIRYRHAPYNAGSWSWNAEEAVDESNYSQDGIHSLGIDSQNRPVVGYKASSDGKLRVKRRASAGGWSDLSGLPDITPTSVQVVCHNDDVYVWFTDATGLHYIKWDDSAGSWGSIVTRLADATAAYVSVRRNTDGSTMHAICTTGSASPYTIQSDTVTLNAAPAEPTLTLSPQSFDAASGTDITIEHKDDDQMSAFALQRVDGTETRWWNGTDFSATSETWVSASGFSVTIPAADNAGDWESGKSYQLYAATRDSQGVAGPYNSTAVIANAGSKPQPTITSGTTANSQNYTLQWTVDVAQSKYKVRVLKGAEVISDTGEVASTTARARTVTLPDNNTTYDVELQVWDQAGVASDPVTISVTTSYTPPREALDVVAAGDSSKAAVNVKWRRGTVATGTFDRVSTAYRLDGSAVATDTPRYETIDSISAITVEESTTNLLSENQSSVETDTTGFGWTRSTIARDTTVAWHGVASLKATADGTGNFGPYATTGGGSVAAGETITASVYVRKGQGDYNVRVAIEWKDASNVILGTVTSTASVLTSEWQRITVSGTAPSGTDKVTITVYTVETGVSGDHFFSDGWQVEKKAYATSWTLGGTTRAAETLTIPTDGLSLDDGFSIRVAVNVNEASKRQGAGYPSIFYIRSGTVAAVWLYHDKNTATWHLRTRNDANEYTDVAIADDSLTPDGVHVFQLCISRSRAELYIDDTFIGGLDNPNLTTGLDPTVYLGTAFGIHHINTQIGPVHILSGMVSTTNTNVDTWAWDDNTVALYRWQNDLEGGTQNSVFGDQWAVERRRVGGETWTRLSTVQNPDSGLYAEFDDYSAASGQEYEYRVVALGGNATETPGAPVQGEVEFSQWWFIPTDGADPVNLAYNARASWRVEEDVQVPQTQSRYRRQYRGPAFARLADVSVVLADLDGLTAREWRERLLEHIRSGTVGYLKSPLGDAWKGTLQAPSGQPQDAWRREAVRFQFRETGVAP